MGNRDEQDSGSSPLSARVRSALGVVREQGAASLRGVRRSAAEATDRLKSTQAAERLGAAVETRRVIKKATDAQRRGNHPMAYRLLESEVRENPDDARVVAAFWSAAQACERAEDAIPALLRIIRKLASTGEPERAAELWLELREASPSALVDPSSLVRMVPALEADGRLERVTLALREAMDPRNDPFASPRWRARSIPRRPSQRRAEPSHRPSCTRPSARASRISSPSSRRAERTRRPAPRTKRPRKNLPKRLPKDTPKRPPPRRNPRRRRPPSQR
jgi:hypothetical protein